MVHADIVPGADPPNGNSTNAYRNLTQAVAAALDGDVIMVRDGNYTDDQSALRITKVRFSHAVSRTPSSDVMCVPHAVLCDADALPQAITIQGASGDRDAVIFFGRSLSAAFLTVNVTSGQGNVTLESFHLTVWLLRC